jgi:hypothetical protein
MNLNCIKIGIAVNQPSKTDAVIGHFFDYPHMENFASANTSRYASNPAAGALTALFGSPASAAKLPRHKDSTYYFAS